jgi:DNA-binding XRE family transcriptional regulator
MLFDFRSPDTLGGGLGFYVWRYCIMPKLNPLRLARLVAGKTQWEVTKETGIPQTRISLYEREYREPTPEHKEALAKAYGKEVEDLWK